MREVNSVMLLVRSAVCVFVLPLMLVTQESI